MFKKQKTIKKRIQEELPRRCYQMGIPAVEQPKICWNLEQFKWYTGVKKKDRYILGRCAFKQNVILVDLHNHALQKQNFEEVRDTLIHELVHMRFQNQKHGVNFRGLIARVKKGEVFPIRTAADIREL